MNNDTFIRQLRSVFRLKRKQASELAGQAKESLQRVRRNVLERIKRADLPKDPDVACRTVRPFLPLMADPLELTPTPHKLFAHVELCRRCRGELEQLEELRHVVTVAEVPILREKVITGATAEFMAKVYRLRGIAPESVCCEHAEPHYIDMANYSLQTPAEIYRHVRSCTRCQKRIRKLRAGTHPAQ